MAKRVIVRTGGKAPASGQYRPRGARTEITLTQGRRVPPHGGKAKTFMLVDRTKHKK